MDFNIISKVNRIKITNFRKFTFLNNSFDIKKFFRNFMSRDIRYIKYIYSNFIIYSSFVYIYQFLNFQSDRFLIFIKKISNLENIVPQTFFIRSIIYTVHKNTIKYYKLYLYLTRDIRLTQYPIDA